MNELNNNEIVEINSDNINNAINDDNIIINDNNKKKKENKLPKKNKLYLILSIVVGALIIIGIVVYIMFIKSNKKEELPIENVVLEKENYKYLNGKLIFLDKSDKEIGSYSCVNEDPNKCFVMKNDYSSDKFERVKSVYENGDDVIKYSPIFNDNFVFVTDGDESYLYNIEEKKKELKVNNIKTYSTEKNYIVILDEDNKYGLIEINSEGFNYLIRPSYDGLGIVNTKLCYLVANDKEKTYIIDSEGKKISDNISGLINSVSEDYIVVLKKDTYSLFNYKNEELLSDYNYIGLYDNVIGLVENNRLFLRDNKLNKLTEDGYRLKNSYYVKKYIYDSNNNLKEVNKAFEILAKDNSIMVTIDDEVKNVNILEGLISSKYSYMSYFDGKLYFYNDEEKEDLLGSYTCNNKNDITSSDSAFNKCNILSFDDGYSGIYNNNIVIINDNFANNDIKYTVYSLKEKKVKGTYSYIDIVNKDEISSNIDHIGTSNSYIISQTDTGTNKGNYGLLVINSEKIIGKGFDYKEINKEGNYYIFKNVNGIFSLYNEEFNKIGANYNYIKLYDKYYVGIIDNKFNIYNYNSGLKILENDLDITDNNYEISFDNGFEVKINDNVYKYSSDGKLIIPDNNEIPNENQNEGDNNNEA